MPKNESCLKIILMNFCDGSVSPPPVTEPKLTTYTHTHGDYNERVLSAESDCALENLDRIGRLFNFIA